MTRGLVRACLIAAAAFAAFGFACDERGGTELQVALRSNASGGASADLMPADRIAVVRLDAAAPVTVVSTPAAQLLASFRAALSAPARPATSPVVILALPESRASGLAGMPLEIVLFMDMNGDTSWQAGEPYAVAWTGGRGGYRLILDSTGPAAPQWRLVEGGEPPRVHAGTAGIVVYIDPVRPAIER